MYKSKLKPLSAAMGLVTAIIATSAQAVIDHRTFTGYFLMLHADGEALPNLSITVKGANVYQTPISGSMSYDTTTGTGTATLATFNFFSGSLPMELVSFDLQSIGDGMSGPGTLILGNMLFNWNGNFGIPVSLIMDAAGFFTNGTTMATPASDDTFVGGPGTVTGLGGNSGYLGLGPNPIVTTLYDTTNGTGCLISSCISVSPSGTLPLVIDSAVNDYDYTGNVTGLPANNAPGIGGSPVQDGPFLGLSFNIDFTTLSSAPVVPIPATAWLFGSGLLGLIGVARRKKNKDKSIQ